MYTVLFPVVCLCMCVRNNGSYDRTKLRIAWVLCCCVDMWFEVVHLKCGFLDMRWQGVCSCRCAQVKACVYFEDFFLRLVSERVSVTAV
jgi:hypothetical protein